MHAVIQILGKKYTIQQDVPQQILIGHGITNCLGTPASHEARLYTSPNGKVLTILHPLVCHGMSISVNTLDRYRGPVRILSVQHPLAYKKGKSWYIKNG